MARDTDPAQTPYNITLLRSGYSTDIAQRQNARLKCRARYFSRIRRNVNRFCERIDEVLKDYISANKKILISNSVA